MLLRNLLKNTKHEIRINTTEFKRVELQTFVEWLYSLKGFEIVLDPEQDVTAYELIEQYLREKENKKNT